MGAQALRDGGARDGRDHADGQPGQLRKDLPAQRGGAAGRRARRGARRAHVDEPSREHVAAGQCRAPGAHGSGRPRAGRPRLGPVARHLQGASVQAHVPLRRPARELPLRQVAHPHLSRVRLARAAGLRFRRAGRPGVPFDEPAVPRTRVRRAPPGAVRAVRGTQRRLLSRARGGGAAVRRASEPSASRRDAAGDTFPLVRGELHAREGDHGAVPPDLRRQVEHVRLPHRRFKRPDVLARHLRPAVVRGAEGREETALRPEAPSLHCGAGEAAASPGGDDGRPVQRVRRRYPRHDARDRRGQFALLFRHCALRSDA